MEKQNLITNIIRKELITALGCTEPIAIAYASSIVSKQLGGMPDSFDVNVSGDIIKNVKGVIVPNTGGQKGIKPAVIAGALSAKPEARLEILNELSTDQISRVKGIVNESSVKISKKQGEHNLYIEVVGFLGENYAKAIIENKHTNVTHISKNDKIVFSSDKAKNSKNDFTGYDQLSFDVIYDFIEKTDLADFEDLLQMQIEYNCRIAQIGLNEPYGLGIGKTLLKRDKSPENMAAAYAAAGSDARMSGCDSAVVINSGSGNQGLAVSLPIYIFGRETGSSQESIYRAMLLSNLISIYIKSKIGTLSAFCGAVSAGTAAGAGITYLKGGNRQKVSDTIINSLSNLSGVICDGAKPSCAYKIASGVQSGVLASELAMDGCVVENGDGIISSNVDKTVTAVSDIVKIGMQETDNAIIDIMIESE